MAKCFKLFPVQSALMPVSNTYKFSFNARTIPEWNSLLAEVIDQLSVGLFRVSLVSFCYLNGDLLTFISYFFFLFYICSGG